WYPEGVCEKSDPGPIDADYNSMTSCGSYCQHSFRLKFERIRHAPAMPQNNLEGRDSIRSFHFGILFAISNNTKTIPPNQKNQWSATARVKSKISCRTGYPPRQAGALGSVSWKGVGSYGQRDTWLADLNWDNFARRKRAATTFSGTNQ